MSNKNKPEGKELVIRPASLPQAIRALIQVPTPKEFIKTRPGKGGRPFQYVEGGYIIAQLNKIFSPVGWEFTVISERIETNEVVVRCKLTIKDHANGATISKEQYGTHPRLTNIPLGDTLKAATTDALKKCATLLGISLDVYWKQDYLESMEPKQAKEQYKINSFTAKPDELLAQSLKKIEAENDPTILTQFVERINSSALYTQAQKLLLIKALNNKLATYT